MKCKCGEEMIVMDSFTLFGRRDTYSYCLECGMAANEYGERNYNKIDWYESEATKKYLEQEK